MAENRAKKSDTLWRPVNVRKESLPMIGGERQRQNEREKNWKNGDIDRNKVNFKYVHVYDVLFSYIRWMEYLFSLYVCVRAL